MRYLIDVLNSEDYYELDLTDTIGADFQQSGFKVQLQDDTAHEAYFMAYYRAGNQWDITVYDEDVVVGGGTYTVSVSTEPSGPTATFTLVSPILPGPN